jgi:EmrB/QacA subfamily drug resistance transporter
MEPQLVDARSNERRATQRPRSGLPGTASPHRLALTVLSGVLAMDIGGLNVVNAALPGIGVDFGLDSTALQWTMTSYAVTFAGFLLFGGRLADVLGRRRVLQLGVGLTVAASAVAGLAPVAAVLFIARGAQGLGAALSIPSALALLGQLFAEGPARDRALSIYAAVAAAAGSSGFVLGGVFTDAFGWRSVVALPLVVGLAVLVAARRVLPPAARQRRPLDLVGAVLVTSGLVLTVLGVSIGPQSGWDRPMPVISLVAAATFFVGFAVRERRTHAPLLPGSLLRIASLRAGAVAALALSTAAFGLQFFAPLYLQDVLHYSPLTSGLAMAPFSLVVFATATLLAGRLLQRYEQPKLLLAGLALIGLGVASWATTSPSGVYWTQMLPGLVIAGIGIGIVFPTMSSASLVGVPAPLHGVAGAVNVTSQQIGASVGVALLTVVAAAGADGGTHAELTGYHHAYLAAGIACAVAAAISLFDHDSRGRRSRNAHADPARSSAEGAQ